MNIFRFFIYWLSFSLLVVIMSLGVLYWAYRAGHFRDRERARYLALWAEMPEEDKKHT